MSVHEKIPAERIQALSDFIKERGNVSIADISRQFEVSPATARRDLAELAREGLIQRTHGGATALLAVSESEKEYLEKSRIEQEAKCAIGRCAASFVKEGQTVLLDSGTTAFQIAKSLAGIKNLTIITNDLFLAANIEFAPSTTLVVTGGIKRTGQNVLIGEYAEAFFKNLIRVDVAFLMADAVEPEKGITNAGFYEVSVKKSIIEIGKKVILCADSTKIGNTLAFKVCDMDQVDLFITDSRITSEQREKLELAGIPLECVNISPKQTEH